MSVNEFEHFTSTAELAEFDPATFWQAERIESDWQPAEIDFSPLGGLSADADIDEPTRRQLLTAPNYYQRLVEYFSDTAIVTDRFGLDHRARHEHMARLYPAAHDATIEGVAFRYWKDNLEHSQLRSNILNRLTMSLQMILHALEPLPIAKIDTAEDYQALTDQAMAIVHMVKDICQTDYTDQDAQISDIQAVNQRAVQWTEQLRDLINNL